MNYAGRLGTKTTTADGALASAAALHSASLLGSRFAPLTP